ncbi:MAG: glycine cleavage system protein GcvH [Elusimicrobiota bacterium]
MPKPEDCRYLKTHEWITVEGGEATVGLSDHAQKEITDVVFVELPQLGRKVSKGESIAVVESVKAAFDIYAPLSGEITAVNPKLPQNPALVNESPHEKGWLYRLKLSEPKEAESLMSHAQYQDFLKAVAH